MEVYVLTTTWSGWGDQEPNGTNIYGIYAKAQDAYDALGKYSKERREEEKEYGREFTEECRSKTYAQLLSQHGECIELEVVAHNVRGVDDSE